MAKYDEIKARPPEVPVISDEVWVAAKARWVDGHIRNSPVSGTVEAWNHLLDSIDKLKQYIVEELKKV